MHGVKRVRYSKEAQEAQRKKDLAKLSIYQKLNDEAIRKRKDKDYGKEAFDLTTQLLQVCPEFSTIWNYRRLILLNGIFPAINPAEVNEYLSGDLSLTTTLLKQHPKVYSIWNHRSWCLENVPDGPTPNDPHTWRQSYWNKELFVVEKMLDVDARNFHAWNYRRYVLSSMPLKRPEQTELAYTTRKIEANFSNFSAWHQRSKVLTSLWEAGKLDPKKSKEEEFDLVKNAMYTDPGDQSVWIYHRWLIGDGDDATIVQREVDSIQELLDEQPDSKWCMDSLVFYKRLLLSRHAQQLDASRRSTLVKECLDLLSRLQELDTNRKHRYVDLSTVLHDLEA